MERSYHQPPIPQHTGTIDAHVLKEILLALDETMTEADVDEMVDEIDEDGSGAVDYEEFKAVMMG